MSQYQKIKTLRLTIIPFEEKYLTEKYVSWLNDKETMRYSDQKYKNHTLESCREYWESFKGSPNSFFAILADDEHVGNITTYKDVIHKVVDISIMIGDRTQRNKGLGLEAWQGMCAYLFKFKKVRKITAGTLSVNEGMLAIMRKANMTEDGIRKKHCLFEGNEVDMVHSALFNPEEHSD